MIDYENQMKKKINACKVGGNKDILEKYLKAIKVKGLRISTQKERIAKACAFLEFCGKGWQDITQEDFNNYVVYCREENNYKPATAEQFLIGAKVFLKWLGKESLTKDYEFVKHRHRLPVENLLTPEDIKRMALVSKTQRDRALLLLLWDSAAREGEVGALNINNLQFDDNGAVIYLPNVGTGLKTGQRRIRLIDSVLDLKLWLDMHPLRDEPKAPLFVTYKTGRKLRKKTFNHLSLDSIGRIIGEMAKDAEIEKDVSPHKIRHARLTWLVKYRDLNEMELRIYAGWSDMSQMPATYLHLSGKDVEDKLLGKRKEEQDSGLEPVICPRCKNKNLPLSRFCNCGQVLDLKTAMKLEEKQETGDVALSELFQDEEIKNVIMKKLAQKPELVKQLLAS